MKLRREIIIILVMLFLGINDGQIAIADDAAQANNPLADITAFNVQNYYIGELTETDENANQFWLRYAKPFSIGDSPWLFRASLPFNSFPTPPDGSKEHGIGDFNAFAAYLIDVGNPSISFGIGPQITAPTATDDALGSEKWLQAWPTCCSTALQRNFNMVT